MARDELTQAARPPPEVRCGTADRYPSWLDGQLAVRVEVLVNRPPEAHLSLVRKRIRKLVRNH